MPTYVALLRGINVGGHKRLLMADLRESLLGLGFKNIETYVQSGNLVFDSRSKDALKLANRIKKQIAGEFGFEVPVVVRSADSFSKVATKNPLLADSGAIRDQLHVTFFNSSPSPDLLESLKPPANCKCKLEIGPDEVFIQCAGRYSESKLGNRFFESQLKVSCTTRNWKTVSAINQIVDER